MATVSNSNIDASAMNHSPRSSSASMENHTSSPRSRRGASAAATVKTVAVSPPWTQVVRGESEPLASVPSSAIDPAVVPESVSPASSTFSAAEEDVPESGSGPNGGNVIKKPAWKKPHNGAASPEMIGLGAESWPALSESVRAPSKPNSDPYKGQSDGSSFIPSSPQGTGIVSSKSQNQIPGSDIANPISTLNNTIPAHQRSMKRNGGNSSANGGTTQPLGLHGPVGEAHLNSPSPRDHNQRSSQSRSGNDHPQQQRSALRNRSGGPHSRGDGSHNHGVRRDHDRSNQDWTNRNFNGRDGNMQQQRGLPRFVRHQPPPPPPQPPGPYLVPPPFQPFGAPIGYSVYYGHPQDYLRGMPFFTGSAPPVFLPAPDLQLHWKIVNQIDYYFSDENLVKDAFLRQNMDDQGWVPIKLIAGFNKVMQLTDNIQLVLDAVRSSTVIEVQGDKVRRRNDWMRWIIPPAVRFPNVSSPQSHGGKANPGNLRDHMQNLSLEERSSRQSNARTLADNLSDVSLAQSSSGDLSNESQLFRNKETDQASGPGDLNHSTSAEN